MILSAAWGWLLSSGLAPQATSGCTVAMQSWAAAAADQASNAAAATDVAKGIDGVLRIVPLPYGVGVIAKTPWAAFDAKEALKVTWSRSGTAWGFNSDKANAA